MQWLESREEKRVKERKGGPVQPWQKWGAYVSERSWGTVREDYSPNGDAWNFFTHDAAIDKAYRWGEDAIAGWCDRYQILVFAPAFWNGVDPILKERLFGLGSKEGNHGEDVKEIYAHLDATPTGSYMKYLYKYPQEPFPYALLREENRRRSTKDPEYELIDTGLFARNRYFDIVIEYAKASPEDLCIKIEAFNRGPIAAPLHILPHLWFRNQWSGEAALVQKPSIVLGKPLGGVISLVADDTQLPSPKNLSFDYHLGKRYLYAPFARALFTDNETGAKGDFHRYLVKGKKEVEMRSFGTKGCLHYHFKEVPAHGSVVLYLRFSDRPHSHPLDDVEKVVQKRRGEADHFYAKICAPNASADEQEIQRQAYSGLLWSRQMYLFDVNLWMKAETATPPPPPSRARVRNVHWQHLNSMRLLTMPDKWEYPYFCAWDQAFHCLTLAHLDIESAKEQLWLLLFDQFQHPNGQIPACEWEFSDLNPPLQAWAAFRLYEIEKKKKGKGEEQFLQKCFHKLLMNFAWWVNKVDSSGNNIFEGGFLGLDNIALLDRSQPIAEGVRLQQSDGSGWMAMFCLNLMRIALELSHFDAAYEELATKFFEHYVYIAAAMKKKGNQNYELWSEKDGFFYDVLTYPDGHFAKFRVRSLVGIIPLYAVEIIEQKELDQLPEFKKNFEWFLHNRKDLVEHCVIPCKGGKYLLNLMDKKQLEQVLGYVWNPEEFRAPFGLRSLSKFHEKHPFVFEGQSVGYEPAESLYKVKGGNSNWRGPIWLPTNFLLITSLKKLAGVFEEEIAIKAPGEEPASLNTMARFFADRLISLFAKDKEGRRPLFDSQFPFANDPHWQNIIPFYEYYNPDTGKGLGASQQTGWSALVADLIHEFR